MAGEGERQVLCPACNAVIGVDPEWRIAQCPSCGTMVTRMGQDSAFD
jgi:predicted RNA-binding Zn-ribbon protein involved in translation (DUF1610 family)